MKTLLGLVTILMVVIAQPKPYPPTGPAPDSGEPAMLIAAEETSIVEHCQGKVTVVYSGVIDGKVTMHMELEAVGPSVNKLYISREATVSAKEPKEGAIVLKAMAAQLAKEASADGFEVTAEILLENANLKQI